MNTLLKTKLYFDKCAYTSMNLLDIENSLWVSEKS